MSGGGSSFLGTAIFVAVFALVFAAVLALVFADALAAVPATPCLLDLAVVLVAGLAGLAAALEVLVAGVLRGVAARRGRRRSLWPPLWPCDRLCGALCALGSETVFVLRCGTALGRRLCGRLCCRLWPSLWRLWPSLWPVSVGVAAFEDGAAFRGAFGRVGVDVRGRDVLVDGVRLIAEDFAAVDFAAVDFAAVDLDLGRDVAFADVGLFGDVTAVFLAPAFLTAVDLDRVFAGVLATLLTAALFFGGAAPEDFAPAAFAPAAFAPAAFAPAAFLPRFLWPRFWVSFLFRAVC